MKIVVSWRKRSRPFVLASGRQMGIASIQKKLSSIKLPDISGTEHVDPIGKVQYSFTG